jgi:hypothetical protein
LADSSLKAGAVDDGLGDSVDSADFTGAVRACFEERGFECACAERERQTAERR